MNILVIKWATDLSLGIVFLFSAGTGAVKYLYLIRFPGIGSAVLPMAQISDIHDRSGILLSIIVAVHLYLNRGWILSMTRKVLSGTAGSP